VDIAGLTIRDKDGWVGEISAVIEDTIIASPKGVGPDHKLYASRAWQRSYVVVTQDLCWIDVPNATLH
jgi:hypothetical protein